MGGLTVTFRLWQVRYFPAGEPVAADEPIAGFDDQEDRLLADHPRMRRILLRGRPDWPLHRYFLHWSDGTDLADLDRRVAAGRADQSDFADAVVGWPLTFAHQECGADLRAVVLDVVVPLFPDGSERARTHAYRTACPRCGGALAGNVLEFIPDGHA